MLLVPISIDALAIKNARQVADGQANFALLPWSDGQNDHNADRTNVAEGLLSGPFENDNLVLNRGMHLHWALPRVLTRDFRKRAAAGTQT